MFSILLSGLVLHVLLEYYKIMQPNIHVTNAKGRRGTWRPLRLYYFTIQTELSTLSIGLHTQHTQFLYEYLYIQVLDNHVIKYYPPGEYQPGRERPVPVRNPKGCLLIGAEATDPTQLTKEYCGLFKHSGVVPKKHLARFYISPEAMLPVGTPLGVLHFQVGNVVDVRGKT